MSPKPIQSRANPHFKALRQAMKCGFGSDVFPVEGNKLIEEAGRAGLQFQSVWTTPARAISWDCPQYELPESLYRAISPTKSGNAPLCLVRAPELPQLDVAGLTRGRWMLLDEIQEPGNAGALARVAAAFDMAGILWRRPCVYPFHHACIRASAGAVFHLRHALIDGPIPEALALPVIGADIAGQPLPQFQWPRDFVLAMGNEGHGLSVAVQARLTAKVTIAIADKVESLNVAGAAHILIHHFSTQGISKPH